MTLEPLHVTPTDHRWTESLRTRLPKPYTLPLISQESNPWQIYVILNKAGQNHYVHNYRNPTPYR